VNAGTLDAWSLEVRELTTQCQPYGVPGLSLSPASSVAGALAGGQRRYSLDLENTGALTDSYTVTLGAHAWPIAYPAFAGPLAPGAHAALPFTVTVPLTVPLGASDFAALTLTSHADPAVSASAYLLTTAIAPTHFLFLPSLLFFPLSSPLTSPLPPASPPPNPPPLIQRQVSDPPTALPTSDF
jgi:hypothetical protein